MTGLFVSTFGAGRPILCLHGIEAHGVRFIGLGQRLRDGRVVAPDLRGHGRSPTDGPWTVEQHMHDLVPILEELGPDSIVLGHSYGGLIAWELARTAPELVTGLILVDPAICVTAELAHASIEQFSAVDRRWPDHRAAFDQLAAERPAGGQWSAALDVAVAIRMGEDGWLRPRVYVEAVRAGWQQMQQPMRPSTYRGPTLLLEAGREDGLYVSAAVVEQMGAQLGEALTHVVLDATHTIPSDFPDLLAQHVARFV